MARYQERLPSLRRVPIYRHEARSLVFCKLKARLPTRAFQAAMLSTCWEVPRPATCLQGSRPPCWLQVSLSAFS